MKKGGRKKEEGRRRRKRTRKDDVDNALGRVCTCVLSPQQLFNNNNNNNNNNKSKKKRVLKNIPNYLPFNHLLASITVNETCGNPISGTQSSKQSRWIVIDSADGATLPSVASCASLILPSKLSSAKICTG